MNQAVTSDALLQVRDLAVEFRGEHASVHAVRGVSFDVHPGEVLGIVGESGSGKSVTSLSVMGLLPPSARVRGSVRLGGRELLGLRERELAGVRGSRIALIFQDPMTSLNPVYSVGWQVAEAVRAHSDLSRDAASARAVELLDAVGLPDPAAQAARYPHELSGGMLQRAVIAVALAGEPEILLADEPTSALDVTVQAQVLDTFRAVRERFGVAIVLITHDLGVVAGQADRVLVMYAGKVVEEAGVYDLFDQPRMPYTLGLLGALPRLDDPSGARLTPIPGAPPPPEEALPACAFAPRCPLVQPVCLEIEPPLAEVAPSHRAACHFSERLIGAAPADIYRAGAGGEAS